MRAASFISGSPCSPALCPPQRGSAGCHSQCPSHRTVTVRRWAPSGHGLNVYWGQGGLSCRTTQSDDVDPRVCDHSFAPERPGCDYQERTALTACFGCTLLSWEHDPLWLSLLAELCTKPGGKPNPLQPCLRLPEAHTHQKCTKGTWHPGGVSLSVGAVAARMPLPSSTYFLQTGFSQTLCTF